MEVVEPSQLSLFPDGAGADAHHPAEGLPWRREPRAVFDDLRARGGEAVALLGSTLSNLTSSGVWSALQPRVASLVMLRLLASAMEAADVDVIPSGGEHGDGHKRRVNYLMREFTVRVALREPFESIPLLHLKGKQAAQLQGNPDAIGERISALPPALIIAPATGIVYWQVGTKPPDYYLKETSILLTNAALDEHVSRCPDCVIPVDTLRPAPAGTPSYELAGGVIAAAAGWLPL